jgi:hypothetical protein
MFDTGPALQDTQITRMITKTTYKDRSRRLWGASNGKNELAHASLEELPINPNAQALGDPMKRDALSDRLRSLGFTLCPLPY